MALDFPGSPSIGDDFSGGGFTWVWNGTSWDKLAASSSSESLLSLWYRIVPNSPIEVSQVFPAGLYRIVAIRSNYSSTATVGFNFANSNRSIFASGITLDTDPVSSTNNSEIIVMLNQQADYLFLSSTSEINVSVQALSTPISPSATLQVQPINSSQTVTIGADVKSVLVLGGGGGGGQARGFNNWDPGHGGGSGYISALNSVAPGSYSVIIGAGAPGGSFSAVGGQSSFGNLTAAGGFSGRSSFDGDTPNSRRGGSAGGQAQSVGFQNGGGDLGSGVSLPWWSSFQVVTTYSAGQPGVFYSGGSGGLGFSQSGPQGGGAAANTGGGGGGGSGSNNTPWGGPGGSGVVLILKEV